MNRLEAELERLYRCREAGPAAEDGVRAVVLELARPAAWEPLARVWQGVQADLELPAPAIAVSGVDSYQLWFSFSEPVRPAAAAALLEGLRARYLAEVAPERIRAGPPGAAPPPFEAGPGRWSAFLSPDLATLFADEPWLDLPPGTDAQAELLSRLASIQPAGLQRAMERLDSPSDPPDVAATALDARSAPAGGTRDPRRFLLDVMNDEAVALHLRIEAAKALLPWCEGRPGQERS